MRFIVPPAALLVATMLSTAGCKKDDDDDEPSACVPEDDSTCPTGTVCEEVVGEEPACFAPLRVQGRVYDTLDDGGIAGALVVARDANGAARSPVATTDADGTYELVVPTARDLDGQPVGEPFTLRADAMAYQSFPTPPRAALPVDPTTASGDEPVLDGPLTQIGLIPLPDVDGLGAIEGRVDGESPGGTLVVADGQTGVADLDGHFVIFNVREGSHTVSGYAVGQQLGTAEVDVDAGAHTDGVVLPALGSADATVSGTVQIVNAPGGSTTSVILVVEDTFDADAIRGQAPPGLRVADIEGAWSIPGVPDGRYVVLAAFENDDLVRDPDTSIGGTDIVTIEVSGADVEVDGFKVTEALAVVSPGAEQVETVEAPVTLTWADDSSEDSYLVEVYDALGERVWSAEGDFDPGGSAPASVAYDGPLQPGMVYQFRATSLKDGVPLSTTEDLRGVFEAP